jgi:putative peptidoglycan lipid II flippase
MVGIREKFMTAYKSLAGHYLFKNASITATLSGAGVVSGLILDALILSAFGVGEQTDALFTALTLPLLITSLLAIQGPKVLIPVFTEYFGRNDQANAWRLLSNLLTTGFCALIGISLVGMALSGVIVPLQILGLPTDTVYLAVWLSRILFWLVLCQGLASILQSVLYAQERYLISSAGRLVANCLTISVVVLGHAHFGIEAVAAGMLVGWLGYVAVLALALCAHGFRYRWVFQPADRELQALARSFRYPLTGHVLGESGMLLQNLLSSFLGSGSLSVVRYASRIVQSVAGIFLSSVIQVTFPLISKHAAERDLKAQRQTLLKSIQLLTGVGLPICIWLVLAAKPLIILLFERGEFSRADAALTSVVLGLMVPSILLSRLATVAQTLFYANLDTRTPFISDLIFTVSHTVLALSLVGLLGVLGLPMAVSLAPLITAAYIIAKLQSRFGPIGWSELWAFGVRLSATCAMAAVGFALGTRLTTVTTVSYSSAKILDFAVPTTLGVCAFIAGAFLFRLIDGSSAMHLKLRTDR